MESYAAGETTTPLLDETIGARLERTVAAWPDREALVEVAEVELGAPLHEVGDGLGELVRHGPVDLGGDLGAAGQERAE